MVALSVALMVEQKVGKLVKQKVESMAQKRD